MEPIEISDIIFANYSEVYAEIAFGVETGIYHVYSGKYLYKISTKPDRFRITKWSNLNHFPNTVFYRKADIKTFSELETFILSKLLLE